MKLRPYQQRAVRSLAPSRLRTKDPEYVLTSARSEWARILRSEKS